MATVGAIDSNGTFLIPCNYAGSLDKKGSDDINNYKEHKTGIEISKEYYDRLMVSEIVDLSEKTEGENIQTKQMVEYPGTSDKSKENIGGFIILFIIASSSRFWFSLLFRALIHPNKDDDQSNL